MSNWIIVSRENNTTGRGGTYADGEYKSTVRDMEPVFLEKGDIFVVPKREGEGVTDVDKDLRKARFDPFTGDDGKERKIDFVFVKLVPQKELTAEEKAAYEKDPEVKKVYLNTFTRSVRQYDENDRPVWGPDGMFKASGTVVEKYQEYKGENPMKALDAIAGRKILVKNVEYVRNRYSGYQTVLEMDFID